MADHPGRPRASERDGRPDVQAEDATGRIDLVDRDLAAQAALRATESQADA